MTEMATQIYISILESVLKTHHIPKEEYSIGEYKEEALCLEQESLNFVVYSGERGNKYNINKFKSIRNACYNFLDRIAETDNQAKQMINSFNTLNRYISRKMLLLNKAKVSRKTRYTKFRSREKRTQNSFGVTRVNRRAYKECKRETNKE